jgi:hypothetical protein
MLQGFKAFIKKHFIAAHRSAFSVIHNIPHPLTAPPACPEVRTGKTELRQRPLLLQKGLCLFRGKKFIQGMFCQAACIIFIQDIKIARVYAPIGFYHILGMTAAVNPACCREALQKIIRRVIEKFDTDIGTTFQFFHPPIIQPGIKQSKSGGLESKRKYPLFIQSFQARNKLYKFNFFVLDKTPYLVGFSSEFIGKNAENIVFHFIFFQQDFASKAAGESPLSVCIRPVTVMDFLAAVNGKPYKKIILAKKFSPGIIDTQSIGLEGVIYLYIFVLYANTFRELSEPVQACQSWLASLKRKGYLVFVIQVPVNITDDPVHNISRHNSIGMSLPVFTDIIIKAIAATHVTERRSRLNKEG